VGRDLPEDAGEDRSEFCRALDGRFIASGPSGRPLLGWVQRGCPRAATSIRWTPQAVPSRCFAWETRCWRKGDSLA